MPNIAAAAIHPNVEPTSGKNIAKSALKCSEKGDFRQHLATVKAATKAGAQTAADTTPALADAANDMLETKADAASPQPKASTPVVKTIKPAKRNAPERASASAKPAIPGAIQPAATIMPALPVLSTKLTTDEAPLAAAGHAPAQNHTEAAQPLKQTTQANAAANIFPQAAQAGTASHTAIATQATQITAPPGQNPALPHTPAESRDIAAQLADALPQSTAKPGANSALHILLKPETLGSVTLKLQHDNAGNPTVTITASQPETLETLKKNVADLNQILTNAGVSEAGRQIDLHAAPVTAAQSGSALGNAGNSPMQGNSSGQQTPQNGTGFAHATPQPPNPPSSHSAPAAAPARQPAKGSLNMIA